MQFFEPAPLSIIIHAHAVSENPYLHGSFAQIILQIWFHDLCKYLEPNEVNWGPRFRWGVRGSDAQPQASWVLTLHPQLPARPSRSLLHAYPAIPSSLRQPSVPLPLYVKPKQQLKPHVPIPWPLLRIHAQRINLKTLITNSPESLPSLPKPNSRRKRGRS